MAGSVAAQKPFGAPDVLKPKPPGDVYVQQVQYTGPASYATGGDALLALLPFPYLLIEKVQIDSVVPAAAAQLAAYNYATGKLQLFVASTGAEVAGAVNASAVSVNLSVWGR